MILLLTGETEKFNMHSLEEGKMRDIEANTAALQIIINLMGLFNPDKQYANWKMLYRIKERLKDRANEILQEVISE